MARLPKNIILDQNRVRQEIDISDWLGVDSIEPNVALAIGQELVDQIKARTAQGKDIFGNSFEKYSESYKNSQSFKAAGKGNRVNLRLSSDMLESIDVDFDGEKLILFLPEDQSPKAHGHMTGQEGQGPLPKRQFFGVTKDQFEEVAAEFGDEIFQAQPQEVDIRSLTSEIRTLGQLFSLEVDDEL